MEFSFALSISERNRESRLAMQSKLVVFQSLSDKLKQFFSDKSYGDDVESFLIGIIHVDPVFDQFFKPRKPKYVKDRKRVIVHGIPVEYEKSFEYTIKLDYEEILQATDEEVLTILKREILNSLSLIDKVKMGAFDKEAFKSDMHKYLSQLTSL